MQRGILLIDHGSRRAEAHEQLLDIAERLRSRLRGEEIVSGENFSTPVAIAHLEIQSPTIQEGFSECVRLGATQIVALPCFLSRGRHVTEDIPELLKKAAQTHGGIPFSMGPPLAEHAGFIELLFSAFRSDF